MPLFLWWGVLPLLCPQIINFVRGAPKTLPVLFICIFKFVVDIYWMIRLLPTVLKFWFSVLFFTWSILWVKLSTELFTWPLYAFLYFHQSSVWFVFSVSSPSLNFISISWIDFPISSRCLCFLRIHSCLFGVAGTYLQTLFLKLCVLNFV